MKEMKYIVTERDSDGRVIEEIFIFPKSVNHDVFALGVERLKNQSHGRWERITREVISAGFTDAETCYGKSESLGLESRKDEDTALLKSHWGS